MRLPGGAASLVICVLGCARTGGVRPAPSPTVIAPEPEVMPPPVELAVRARRTGETLGLDLKGIGKQRAEGEPFEDPERWQVVAACDGVPLERLVNGPARIAREPLDAEGKRWDVEVRFSVAFAMPHEKTSVDVRVEAPFAAPLETTISELHPGPRAEPATDQPRRKPKRKKRALLSRR